MAYDIEWYFAWVDAPSTEFDGAFDPVAHAVQDIEILGFTFEHREGDFATLQITTRNPLGEGGYALGLLGPGRKRWAWFSWNKGDGVEPLFFGRLVGIPTDIFGAKTVLDFQARPVDYVDQKDALAEELRVLPWYDETFYDEERRTDPEIVLEARSAVWHVDPVTHELTISDILIGEEGDLVFTAAQHLFNGMQFTLGSPPLTSVTVEAEFLWTQRAAGDVTMEFNTDSYTLDADSYPGTGTSFGNGWTVKKASVSEPWDFAVQTESDARNLTIKWWDGEITNIQTSFSEQHVAGPGEGIPAVLTHYVHTYANDPETGDIINDHVEEEWTSGFIPRHKVRAEYEVGYDADRPFSEFVVITLPADVQETVTLPGEDETMNITGLKTVNLSTPIGDDLPIVDPRRRSYVVTARGRQSLLYLMLRARAPLRLRARCANITFVPFVDRLSELRLNKTATVSDWRLPGGVATGKITSFTCTLTPPTDSGGGGVALSVTMGCAVGNGGTVTGAGGTADYVEDDYILQDEDWQEYEGQIVTFNDDIGFGPPMFAPNDDGIDFISGLEADAVLEAPIEVSEVADDQQPPIQDAAASWQSATAIPIGPVPPGYASWSEARRAAAEAQAEYMAQVMSEKQTEVSFKMMDMRKDFKTSMIIETEPLKIPTMIDLGAT